MLTEITTLLQRAPMVVLKDAAGAAALMIILSVGLHLPAAY